MANAAPQRLLMQGLRALVEYVPVLVGGVANAFQVPSLDANGQLNITMMPTGVGPDVQIMPASEAISAGALVNVYSNSGTATVRNADGSTTGKEAHGYVLAAVASAANATVYFSGINNAVSGLTPGDAYLSDTAVGAIATAGATTAGHTYQEVGQAISATALQFAPQTPVTRS